MLLQGRTTRRAGFTLIELLVVISIIAVLAALSAAGIFKWVESTRVSNTVATLQTVEQLLQKHWNKVVADARIETPSDAVYALAGGDPARAKVIWIKVRLLEAFPLRFDEINPPMVAGVTPPPPLYALIPSGFPPPPSPPSFITPAALVGQRLIPPGKQKYIATYQKMLAGRSAANNATTESSACLLMALSIDRGIAAKANLDGLSADTDGDGIKELVDNWGNPLVFYRFPWGNTELDLSNPAPPNSKATKLRDPLDPDGELMKAVWNNSTNYTTNPLIKVAELYCHPVHDSTVALPLYAPKSWYMIPTVVSAGNDGLIGLAPGSMALTSTVQASDNIYSYKLQIGGGAK